MCAKKCCVQNIVIDYYSINDTSKKL